MKRGSPRHQEYDATHDCLAQACPERSRMEIAKAVEVFDLPIEVGLFLAADFRKIYADGLPQAANWVFSHAKITEVAKKKRVIASFLRQWI